MSRAIISGITGQDGSYLADLLVEKGYEVWGLTRRSSVPRYDNIVQLLDKPKFHLVESDLLDPIAIRKVVGDVQPNEFYNLAAQSHVQTSFNQPTLTLQVNTVGVLNILEAIRDCSKGTKFYQASTSEMWGQNYNIDSRGKKYQDETTPFAPRSPYGVSKLAAHSLVRVYRESYNIFACNGILMNHESPRRGHLFVTRKITRWLANFYQKHYAHHSLYISDAPTIPVLEDKEKLRLGNLEAVRDWGHAQDYVRAMYLMLQQSQPDDYVVATGTGYTVGEFLDVAFKHINCDLDYRNYVVIDPALYRPADVDFLQGHPWKAKQKLGWKPKFSFEDLVIDMIEADINLVKQHGALYA